jgi:serine/threonine protein kinase
LHCRLAARSASSGNTSTSGSGTTDISTHEFSDSIDNTTTSMTASGDIGDTPCLDFSSTTSTGATADGALTGPLPLGAAYVARGSFLYDELWDALRKRAARAFEAGAPLGAGGQGEVRRVALLGRSYALKRSLSSCEGVPDIKLGGAPARELVMSPLLTAQQSPDYWNFYHLYELAAGDLTDAIVGLTYSSGEACLSPDQLARVLRQMAEALGAMHSAGLAHNDVKPANFLLGYDGRLKIGDLGLTDRAGETPAGRTPCFAAPELVLALSAAKKDKGAGDEAAAAAAPAPPRRAWWRLGWPWGRRARASAAAPADAPTSDWRRADVYSLGVAALQLCLGAKCDAFAATMNALQGGVAFVAPEGMPADLSALLGGMLACDPCARPTIDAVPRHPSLSAATAPRRALDLLALAEHGRGDACAGAGGSDCSRVCSC